MARLAAAVLRRNGSGYNNPNAVSGNQVAFIQGSGEVSQDVTFAQAGEYSISLMAAYRDFCGGSNPIAVLIDGVQVDTIIPALDFPTVLSNGFVRGHSRHASGDVCRLDQRGSRSNDVHRPGVNHAGTKRTAQTGPAVFQQWF